MKLENGKLYHGLIGNELIPTTDIFRTFKENPDKIMMVLHSENAVNKKYKLSMMEEAMIYKEWKAIRLDCIENENGDIIGKNCYTCFCAEQLPPHTPMPNNTPRGYHVLCNWPCDNTDRCCVTLEKLMSKLGPKNTFARAIGGRYP